MWAPINDIDGTPTDVNAIATSPDGNNNEEKSKQLLVSFDVVQQETDERDIPTTQEVVMESEMEISSIPVEDDSPVEEASLVKKKPSKRRQKKRSKIDDSDKEQRNVPWTMAEEIALCNAWVNTSEDSDRGNAKKAQGFWTEVLQYLEREMGVSGVRTYDSINCKWKGLRGKVSQFCSSYDNVVRRNENENEVVLQKAIDEYRAEYGMHFTLLHAWRLLKDHKKWKEVELPKIRGQGHLGKKSKSNSLNTSESAHVVQEARPIGGDKAKKKVASSFVPSVSSGEQLVDMSMEKWTKAETCFLEIKKGEWDVFLELKKQEIEIKKREIALREKEFEFLQDKQRQKDELLYTTPHDHLRGKQLEKVLETKEKIKAKYKLDY